MKKGRKDLKEKVRKKERRWVTMRKGVEEEEKVMKKEKKGRGMNEERS